MGVSLWATENWFELLQSIGIVGGFLFTAYATLRDERAKKIGNLIAMNEQYREIWKLYKEPGHSRVLKKDVNLDDVSISEKEALFVNLLILHLDTVYRSLKSGMFVKLEGLQKDIQEFFSLPIPKTIWKNAIRFQDKDFIEFIGRCQQAPRR